jgi:hypothetical protein
MAGLIVHVEGETEESFVNEILRDHLQAFGYERVSARLLGNARLRSRRGGIRGWPAVRGDIIRHLKEDRHCIATTMVDYYALPQSGERAWPGRAAASIAQPAEKSGILVNALAADIANAMGDDFNPSRFVPFVVMHEFEGLLFSDCAAFAQGIGRNDLIEQFQEIRDQFATPEDINDSPINAPSKRVEALVEGYQKPLLGTLAALEIGLTRIRVACPNFNGWLDHIESLGTAGL